MRNCTMTRHLIYILTVLTLVGCGTKDRTGNNENKNTERSQANGNEPDKSAEIITKPCAIMISPTDQKIDSLKNVNGDDFYVIADDNLFYIGTARLLLDSLKTETLEKRSVGKVTFRQTNGTITTVDLTKFYWGILLFNAKDEPIEADMTTFESEFKRYMTK